MNKGAYRLRPMALRRAWMFVPGMDAGRQQAAISAGADVVVADLEEFTHPDDRPRARQRIVELMQACRDHATVGAVRINKLDGDGIADLAGVMPGRPAAVFLPHVESPGHITALDAAITRHESLSGLAHGATEIIPTIESAAGLLALGAILGASPRVQGCLLAAEDLAANLQAERGPDGIELLHARGQFLLECRAQGCAPIDCPFTFRAVQAFQSDLALARRLGFRAKCAVFAEHIPLINACFTPSQAEVDVARELIRTYEAQSSMLEAAPGVWVDAPLYNNARRLLARQAEFAQFEQASLPSI